MNLILLSLAVIVILYFTINPSKKWKVAFNMATVSIAALIVLLLLKVIDIETIISGIIGTNGIEPWKVLVIFFSVAYVSVSTDVTGIFDYIAYRLVRLANGDGIKLFLFFYCFAGFLSIFTSNDIVILTLTPIIFYLGKHAKINIIPLLFAEFFAANTLSMLLYIDNPTNIIMVNALGIGFVEYLSVMWLPTLVAAIVNYILLYLIFRKQITKKYNLNENSEFTVRNKLDATISSTLMIAMFIFLVLSDSMEFSIWKITSIFAMLFIIEDILFSLYYQRKSRQLSAPQLDKREVVLGIPKEKNEFWLAIKRVPWKILPFVTVFFILVYHLSHIGVIESISEWLSAGSNSLLSSIGLNGVVAFISANIINNQPMAILYSYVFTNAKLTLQGIELRGAVYAVIIASNLAANFTIIGALAGLMWKKILKDKGVQISYFDFIKKGIVITPLVFVATLATLYVILQF
ncbi:hypothetical protein KKA15_02435 [Patescibacteria group bacterium]|nr:hypothetical protein [Patescibacteria group bacterium]